MGLKELLERALLEGYATSEINMGTVFLCIGLTAVIAFYIFFVYRMEVSFKASVSTHIPFLSI